MMLSSGYCGAPPPSNRSSNANIGNHNKPEARANQIDMNMQSEFLAAFEENII